MHHPFPIPPHDFGPRGLALCWWTSCGGRKLSDELAISRAFERPGCAPPKDCCADGSCSPANTSSGFGRDSVLPEARAISAPLASNPPRRIHRRKDQSQCAATMLRHFDQNKVYSPHWAPRVDARGIMSRTLRACPEVESVSLNFFSAKQNRPATVPRLRASARNSKLFCLLIAQD